eukprot:GFUD01018235.1.p1 GENE.GFUD01018235.1~~GFUD01018235.1.p1  ORF type:complete len:703 (+),score=228.32 GFUD01018235.1:78-2186(+)
MFKAPKDKICSYFLFMQEQRKLVPGWSNKSNTELQELCDPLWRRLDKEEKDKYKKMKKALKRERLEEDHQRNGMVMHVDRRTKVVVGQVEKPDIVWVSPVREVNAVQKQLAELMMVPMEQVEVGTMAACKFSDDGVVYRCQVVTMDGKEDMVMVKYMEFGNQEKVKINELFHLTASLCKMGPLAVRVWVGGMEGVKDTEKNRAKVEKRLSVEELEISLDREGKATFYDGGKLIALKGSRSNEGSTKSDGIESSLEMQKLGQEVVQEKDGFLVKELKEDVLKHISVSEDVGSLSQLSVDVDALDILLNDGLSTKKDMVEVQKLVLEVKKSENPEAILSETSLAKEALVQVVEELNIESESDPTGLEQSKNNGVSMVHKDDENNELSLNVDTGTASAGGVVLSQVVAVVGMQSEEVENGPNEDVTEKSACIEKKEVRKVLTRTKSFGKKAPHASLDGMASTKMGVLRTRKRCNLRKTKRNPSGWEVGDAVVAFWAEDGVWRLGTVHEIAGDMAYVVCKEQLVRAARVRLDQLKHSSMPVEVLNMMEDELDRASEGESSLESFTDCSSSIPEAVEEGSDEVMSKDQKGQFSVQFEKLLTLLPGVDITTITSPNCSDLLPSLVTMVPSLSTSQLDRLVGVMIMQDLLVTAALHPTGYLLAMQLVHHVMATNSGMKDEVLICLARQADNMQMSTWGRDVLKTLEGFI